jgi:hypothetical protein
MPLNVSRAVRFSSAQAEVEAVGRARRLLQTDLQEGRVLTTPVPSAWGPPRHVVVVRTNRRDGFGDRAFVPRRANGPGSYYLMSDAGQRVVDAEVEPQMYAWFVFEHRPQEGDWQPFTYYPSSEPGAEAGTVEDAVTREFVAHYNSDASEEFDRQSVDQWAEESAHRLLRTTGQPADVARVLDDMRQNRAHPLLASLEAASLTSWTGEEESWLLFRELTALIIVSLPEIIADSARAPAAHSEDTLRPRGLKRFWS